MQKYPIDFDNLQKGDRISTSVLADILQAEPETDDFNLKVLMFMKEVQWELARRKKDFTVVFRKKCLLILTDAESIDYINTMARTGVRKVCKAHETLSKVDILELDDDQKIRFNRSCVVTSALYQSVSHGVKSIPPEPQKRRLGLPVFTEKKKCIM